MRNHSIMLSLLASLTVTSCKDVECGDGTIERDGTCTPATTTTGAAMCGPFTELEGDRCVPMFLPTVCDPATTTPTVDPDTGVTTCVGNGTGGGCASMFACPTPTVANGLTICGQIFDFESMTKFQAQDAIGTPCDPAMPAASGPCAIGIHAYDAIQFASNPAAAAMLPIGTTYIDDCGRYRLVDIDTNGTSPFIGLGFDDAGMPNGPGGVTVTVGVATPKAQPVVANFEGFVVKASTTQLWAASGGPSLAGGIFAASYRKHKLAMGVDRYAPQEGVTFAKAGNTLPDDDFYFMPALTTHTTIDPAATLTGANGTALVANRSISESLVFDGIGGLGGGCAWEPHAAVSLPGIVFIQIFRKADAGAAGSCLD